MKLSSVLAVLFLITSASVGFSQATPFTGAKIAIIDTDGLADAKTGITKLVNAMAGVAQRYKTKDDELTAMQKQLEAIATDLRSGKLDQKAVAEKNDQGEALQRQFTYKQESYKKDFDKDMETSTGPIFAEVNTALQAFARQRGIDVVVDIGKVPGAVLVLNSAVDITSAFIKEFNAKNAAVPVK